MEYDEAGQLIKESSTMGNSRVYCYTSLGKVKSVTDEAGRMTCYSYLPGGKLSEVAYSDGTIEKYFYDDNGNIKTHTDRKGVVKTYEYDSLDRVIRISGSAGEQKEYAYDVLGNVIAKTDVYGNVTRYDYSPTGRLIKVTDALGNETEYVYDLCDRLIEIKQYGEEINGADEELIHVENQNNDNRICHVTRYMRNKLGLVESITDALGHTEHYTYNAKGKLIEKLDKEGYLTKYGYTAQGDVNHIAYADGREVKLSYNPLRQLEEIEDWLGITKIENDAMGRAVRVQYPDGKEVSYAYGKSGERTGIIYPDGKEAAYTYDNQLRLLGLTDENGTITYAYDEKGRLAQKTFPNGMETSYRYNAEGRLAELVHRDREGILDRYAYQYDLTGNKIAIEKQRRGLLEESGSYAYGYDALGRLSTVTRNGENLRIYEYDAFGNRSLLKDRNTETTYAYNAMNQLISRADAVNEETYTYDKRGNLRLIMKNGVLENQYTYGALNRLEQAVNGKGEAALYTYNGLGHRVGKTTGSMEMAVPDSLCMLDVQDIRPEKEIEYIIDLTRQYHNLLQKSEGGNTQSYLWDVNVAGVAEDGNERYYFQDELGSPIRLMDKDGEAEESYGYDEFGQDLYGNQGIVQPFGYTGYQADRIAGTYYAQVREYKADLGRFAGKDVLRYSCKRDSISLNLYVYCKQNPLYYIDFNGHEMIVVSGGTADSDEFHYMFIETAIKNINDLIAEGVPADEITWMVIDAGYSPTDLANFQDTADKLGVNFVSISDKEQMIDYINNKDSGTVRADDPITYMSFFAHGQCPKYSGSDENQLSFAYNIQDLDIDASDINFTQSDIERLNSDAFYYTYTEFFSCNAGTIDDNNGMSFAQAWSNKTGGISYGIENGRTLYAAINHAASWGFYGGSNCVCPMEAWNWCFNTTLWQEKQIRKEDRAQRGYSEYGSLNYPCLVSLAGDLDVANPFNYGLSDRGWKYFFPESCDEGE